MFNFLPQNGAKYPKPLLFHESNYFLQSRFSAQLQWVEMKQDWTLLRKRPNFPYPTSKWHLIGCKYRNLLFHESDDFLQSPFLDPLQWKRNATGFDSTQKRSKISISDLKMPPSNLNWLFHETDNFLQSPISQNHLEGNRYRNFQITSGHL